MTGNEVIKIGDICVYFYDNQNKSFSIVEVVEELSDECVVVKFHQVLRDDSGNGSFTYLCDKGKTMNVSRKYLNKIELINRQKAENDELQYRIKSCNKEIAYWKAETKEARADLMQSTSEAVKEFAERLKELAKTEDKGIVLCTTEVVDNLVKEMTEVEQ